MKYFTDVGNINGSTERDRKTAPDSRYDDAATDGWHNHRCRHQRTWGLGMIITRSRLNHGYRSLSTKYIISIEACRYTHYIHILINSASLIRGYGKKKRFPLFKQIDFIARFRVLRHSASSTFLRGLSKSRFIRFSVAPKEQISDHVFLSCKAAHCCCADSLSCIQNSSDIRGDYFLSFLLRSALIYAWILDKTFRWNNSNTEKILHVCLAIGTFDDAELFSVEYASIFYENSSLVHLLHVIE